MKKMNYFVYMVSGLSLIGMVGCTARIDQRGKVPDPEQLTKIQVGRDSKEDVLRLIGSPSNTGTFDDNTWLYIHKTTETTSFFEPKIIDQQIVTLRFNKAGILEEIRNSEGQGKSVEPIKRTTPAAGEKQTPLQQVFGNFGRYSKKAKTE